MKRDSYSDQQSHASFQPRSPQSAIEPTQLGQPVHHSSSTSDIGAKWLNKASSWVADKLQTARNFMGSGDTILQGRGYANAPNQILPALKGTAKPALSQTNSTHQPLVGVIDSGFGTDEHGSKMVEAIQKENPQAKIWQGGGVGTGDGLESLVEFVDVAKATGQSRAVANLSFDLTEVHPDGSTSTRAQLTAEEQSALAYARDNGVLVVASSGNQGGAMSALGQASQPSDNLIVVGAANGSDRASYSSYGKGLDLVADVGTAGTSLAAAKVTGAIAKLWSANPELSSQQVNQMLTATATDLKAPGWDAETGTGLLNSTAAMGLAKTITPKTQMFSGAQLMQVNRSSEDSTWRSTNGAVVSERTAGLAPDIVRAIPGVGAAFEAVNPKPKDLAEIIPGIGDAVALDSAIARAKHTPPPPNPLDEAIARAKHTPPPPNPLDEAMAEPPAPNPLDEAVARAEREAGQEAFELHRKMERDLSVQISDIQPNSTNPLDEAIARAEQSPPLPNPLDEAVMEQSNSTPGQVAIQQGDTLWDIAQAQLGSGDRWRELRKPDGSPFTEQEASQLQVGTSVQIPGTQPDPIAQPDPIVDAVNTEPSPPMEQPNLTPDPEPNPPAPPAPAPDHVADFFGSVVNKVWEAGEGAVETVTNPGQAVSDLVNSVHTIVNDPGQALNSFLKPYGDALSSGRYGDFLGQIGGDALLAVSPGGLAARIGNGLRKLPDAPPPNIDGIGDGSGTLNNPPPTFPPAPQADSPDIGDNPPPPNPPTDGGLSSSSSPPPIEQPNPTPAPTADVFPPPAPAPAPNLIADNFSPPPTPQAGSPNIGDNPTPSNSLTDGGSPSPSDLELADPNVSRPPAADPDRQLVTVGARDLDRTSSSPDRSTADSRNYEPVAVGGGNGGTRPSDPPTATTTPTYSKETPTRSPSEMPVSNTQPHPTETPAQSPWSPPPVEKPDPTRYVRTTRDLQYLQDPVVLSRLNEIGYGESLADFAERIKMRFYDKNGVELTNSNQPPQEPPAGSGGSRSTSGYDDSNSNGLPAGSGGDSGNSGSSPVPPSYPNQSSSNGGSDRLESLVEHELQEGRKSLDVASDGNVHPSVSQIAEAIRSAQRTRSRLNYDPKRTSAATENGPVERNGYVDNPNLGQHLVDHRDDATFKPSGRDNGVPGSASATHAEPKVVQQDIQANPDSAITALAVDRPMCRSRAKTPNGSSGWCVDDLSLTAMKEGRTIVVAEPGGVWVFHPDIPANFFKGI